LGITPILGPAYTSYARQSNSLPLSTPHVGYNIIDVSQGYPNGVWDARDDVLKKKCWAAIVIHANATSSWRDAIQTGDAGYDPQGSVGIYYEGARYYQIVLLYLRPFVSRRGHSPHQTFAADRNAMSNSIKLLITWLDPQLIQDTSTVLSTASQTALSTILASLSPTYSPPSQYPATGTLTATTGTLLGNLRAVPQAMSGMFGYYIDDLRPQTAWGAAAVFEAGDI
jgi:hypothetical protein